GFGGAVDAVAGVLPVLEQIERPRAEWIASAAFHALRPFGVAFGVARDHRRGRRPVWPLLFFLHHTGAGKGEPFAADADAVTDRLVALLDQIEKTPMRIDHNSAGRMRRTIVDDLLEELRIDAGDIDRLHRELLGRERGIMRHGWAGKFGRAKPLAGH